MSTVNLTESHKHIVRLTAALRKAKRDARKQEADRVVGEALSGSGLPAAAQTRVRSLVESAVRFFVEADPPPATEPPGDLAPTGADLVAGDPATIELPPDVAELPKAAQEIWLESYVVELPKGDARAVNLAWAAVYAAGWVKGDQGWSLETASQPAIPNQPLPDMNTVPTVASLRAAIGTAVTAEKTYLTQMAEAGRVIGNGQSDPPASDSTEKTDAKLSEAYQAWGLTPAQAKVAVKGR